MGHFSGCLLATPATAPPPLLSLPLSLALLPLNFLSRNEVPVCNNNNNHSSFFKAIVESLLFPPLPLSLSYNSHRVKGVTHRATSMVSLFSQGWPVVMMATRTCTVLVLWSIGGGCYVDTLAWLFFPLPPGPLLLSYTCHKCASMVTNGI